MTNINPIRLQQKLIKVPCESCKKNILVLAEVFKKDGLVHKYLSIKSGVQYQDKADFSKIILLCDLCDAKLKIEQEKLMQEKQEETKKEEHIEASEEKVLDPALEEIRSQKYVTFLLRSGEKLTLAPVVKAILDRNRFIVTDDKGITICSYMESFETNLDMWKEVIRND